MAAAETLDRIMSVGGTDLEVEIHGSGAPLLLLGCEEQLETGSPLVEQLSKSHRVIIPSPPGFGHSPRPEWITRAEDIAFVYLDLIEHLELRDVTVVGCSLGGWIAAEMAVADDSFIRKLVLVDAYGVKIGGPFDRDVEDMWIQAPQRIASLMWKNPALADRDFTKMSEEELTVIARNRETFARLCWEPYMHNPKLKHRLHRIDVPTLVLWGENDGIMTADHGRAYAGLIDGAKFEIVPDAGHYPHIENPDAFLAALDRFIG